MQLLDIAEQLTEQLKSLHFSSPVTYVYNPLSYAKAPHAQYLEKYGKQTPREVILVGMNPGPFGMAQTGVPFGEVSLVRDWLKVEAPVKKPKHEHPKRPITGFDCKRSEVSGQRLWGFAKAHFQTPEKFFKKFFVANYCPLVFMSESGANITPDKLLKNERTTLFAACDAALKATIDYLKPKYVIGVGAFVASRLEIICAKGDQKTQVGRITHPSPASPIANRGWDSRVEMELKNLGIQL